MRTMVNLAAGVGPLTPASADSGRPSAIARECGSIKRFSSTVGPLPQPMILLSIHPFFRHHPSCATPIVSGKSSSDVPRGRTRSPHPPAHCLTIASSFTDILYLLLLNNVVVSFTRMPIGRQVPCVASPAALHLPIKPLQPGRLPYWRYRNLRQLIRGTHTYLRHKTRVTQRVTRINKRLMTPAASNQHSHVATPA